MPSVAVLCEFSTLLGGERSWLATVPTVLKAGFSLTCIAPSTGPLAAALKDAGIEHFAWSVHDEFGQRRDLDTLRRELRVALRRICPDVLHANSLSMTRLAGPVIRDAELAAVGHVRDIVHLSRTAVTDVNCTSRLLAVSHAARDFHLEQGVDPRRMEVLYNGVQLWDDESRRPAPPISSELNLPGGAKLVVAVGQIGARKGTDVFIELARCVLNTRRDVHFLVVGECTSRKREADELMANLRRLAKEAPCYGNVHFLGNRNDALEILSQATLVVHAARQEPLGRVLLESAAAAKPIVATEVGGTPEIFPPQSESAVLVPVIEPAEVDGSKLLQTVLRLLDDPATRRALGRAAQRRVEQHFDIRVSATRLVQHYHEVLTNASHHRACTP